MKILDSEPVFFGDDSAVFGSLAVRLGKVVPGRIVRYAGVQVQVGTERIVADD
jgi:hypothetical protein